MKRLDLKPRFVLALTITYITDQLSFKGHKTCFIFVTVFLASLLTEQSFDINAHIRCILGRASLEDWCLQYCTIPRQNNVSLVNRDPFNKGHIEKENPG